MRFLKFFIDDDEYVKLQNDKYNKELPQLKKFRLKPKNPKEEVLEDLEGFINRLNERITTELAQSRDIERYNEVISVYRALQTHISSDTDFSGGDLVVNFVKSFEEFKVTIGDAQE